MCASSVRTKRELEKLPCTCKASVDIYTCVKISQNGTNRRTNQMSNELIRHRSGSSLLEVDTLRLPDREYKHHRIHRDR